MSDSSYQLKAVVAMSSNRVIGRDGKLPWHLSEDLKLFRKTTTGHAIIMGRKTFESIGKPLPKRRNIVLSGSMDPSEHPGIEVISGTEQLDGLGLDGDAFVIGGAQIYAALMPRCVEILLSYVFEEYEGDTFFPEFESDYDLAEVVEKFDEFELRRYTQK